MKRILFFAAALCSMSLCSCDNDNEAVELSPLEMELFELDQLINSQSGFDEKTLLADLQSGTLHIDYEYRFFADGRLETDTPRGGLGTIQLGQVFCNNGKCYQVVYDVDDSKYHAYPHDWSYDSATCSITTKWNSYRITYEGEYEYFDECTAKVLYYNAENHRLILDGDIFNKVRYLWGHARNRFSCHIDMDASAREELLGHCNLQN